MDDQPYWVLSNKGIHSNNSTGTMHDVASDKIVWFTHCTKRESDANWVGTLSGTEGDMLKESLEDVKSKGLRLIRL